MHLPHVGQSQPLPQSHLFPAGQTTFFLLDFKRGRGGVGLTSGRFGFGGVAGGVVRLIGGVVCLIFITEGSGGAVCLVLGLVGPEDGGACFVSWPVLYGREGPGRSRPGVGRGGPMG